MRAWPMLLLCACGRFGFQHGGDPADARADVALDADGELVDGVIADTIVSPDAIESSLVAWFVIEDGIGDRQIDDVSGNGHHARCLVGLQCPTEATGRAGLGLTGFDDASPGLAVADAPSLRLASYTLTAWVRLDSTSQLSSAIAKPLGGTTANSYQIDIDTTGRPRFTTNDGTDLYRITAPSAIALGVWTHIAATYDGQAMSLYVGGVLVDSDIGAPASAYDGQAVYLGSDRNAGSPAENFQGVIDDLRIYSVALDATRIAMIAADQ